MGITSFTQLAVWQKAHQLRLSVDVITDDFPSDERFRLSDQMKRAAHSIAANIAEGFGRRYPPEKIKFYNISEASAEELKDGLIYARDKGYRFDFPNIWRAVEEVCRMLKALMRSTEAWERRNQGEAR